MRKSAFAFAAALLTFFPAKSIAAETITIYAGPWQWKNSAVQSKHPKKKISREDLRKLDAEIQEAEADDKNVTNLSEKLLLRDQMLKSFLAQYRIIGAKRDQVREMLADKSNHSDGGTKPSETEVFLIAGGTSAKVDSNLADRASLALEVSFKNGIADAFRIVMKATSLRKLAEHDALSALDKTIDSKMKPWFWKFELRQIIQDLVAKEAKEALLCESQVPRECLVSFSVTRDGLVSDLAIKHSSLNTAFDHLVIKAVEQISGKPFLRFPVEAKRAFIPVEIGIEPVQRETCRGDSVEEFLKGKCKKLNGVDIKPVNSPPKQAPIFIDERKNKGFTPIPDYMKFGPAF